MNPPRSRRRRANSATEQDVVHRAVQPGLRLAYRLVQRHLVQVTDDHEIHVARGDRRARRVASIYNGQADAVVERHQGPPQHVRQADGLQDKALQLREDRARPIGPVMDLPAAGLAGHLAEVKRLVRPGIEQRQDRTPRLPQL